MDSLDQLADASEEGVKMEVRNPKTGDALRHEDGRPFTITLLGPYSKKYLDISRAQADRRVSQIVRTRNPVLTAVTEKEQLDLLVAVTTGWDIVVDGEPTPFDAKMVRAIYEKYPSLYRQVVEFVGTEGNFLKG